MENRSMTTEVQERTAVSPAPAPLPAARSALPFPRLLPALATGVLLCACYFPLALGWLAWVALVPLLCLVRAEGRARNLYFAAWAGGLIFFWPVLQWMRVADYRMYYTWAMLATYCSLYFPAALYLMRRLDRRSGLPLVLTVPLVWAGLEFVRSFVLTGFSWYYLGHTQHTLLPLIQVSDLGGAYVVSFLVAAVNAWVFELVYQHAGFRRAFRLSPPTGDRPPLVLQAGLLAVAVGGILAYGFWRMEQASFRPGPRLALLQGNLDQRLRNDASAPGTGTLNALRKIEQHYVDLCHIATEQAPRPDLVVWPETSFPGEWHDSSRAPIEAIPPSWRRLESRAREALGAMALQFKAHHLVGVNVKVLDEAGKLRRYNSALMVRDTGDVSDRYDKIHRVPFGEYVPFRDWLPFMDRFAPYDYDYSIRKGEHLTRLDVGGHKFGVVICFEDTDPFLARAYGADGPDGPAADFLVNISNDGWFDGTSEHDEHLAICRFRAVETRRSVARSVNMGVSAVIDGNGRVLAPRLVQTFGRPKQSDGEVFHQWVVDDHDGATELPVSGWAAFKKTAGVLTASIPIDNRTSRYALWGDWFAGACWAVLVLGLFWPFGRRERLAPSPAPNNVNYQATLEPKEPARGPA